MIFENLAVGIILVRYVYLHKSRDTICITKHSDLIYCEKSQYYEQDF